MPAWLAEITVAEIIGWCLAAVAVVAAVVKIRKGAKPILDLFESFREFLAEWNGKPEELDASGNPKKDAEPGVLHRLMTLEKHMASIRHQVKNDHSTNLRDDVDEVIAAAKTVAEKLDEHIAIAKTSDTQQAEIAAKVERLDARYGGARTTE